MPIPGIESFAMGLGQGVGSPAPPQTAEGELLQSIGGFRLGDVNIVSPFASVSDSPLGGSSGGTLDAPGVPANFGSSATPVKAGFGSTLIWGVVAVAVIGGIIKVAKER